ncbi:MAG: class D sortase, partial [Clostridia bacterium]|nr:class D sortase [Clostridia bacterium]
TTILASAHNNTYFNCLQYVKVGDEIKIETTYGDYLYEVYLTEIKSTKDPMYDLAASEETLILYTCYPFTELGITPLRYFVLARLVSGPKVLLDE